MSNDEAILQILKDMHGDIKAFKDEVRSDLSGFKDEVRGDIKELKHDIEFVRGTVVAIENNHGRMIKALYDGYHANLEKHEKYDGYEDRIENLEINQAAILMKLKS